MCFHTRSTPVINVSPRAATSGDAADMARTDERAGLELALGGGGTWLTSIVSGCGDSSSTTTTA